MGEDPLMRATVGIFVKLQWGQDGWSTLRKEKAMQNKVGKTPAEQDLQSLAGFQIFFLNVIRSGGFESRDCHDKLFVLSFVL